MEYQSAARSACLHLTQFLMHCMSLDVPWLLAGAPAENDRSQSFPHGAGFRH
jgi:hypothetical protein